MLEKTNIRNCDSCNSSSNQMNSCCEIQQKREDLIMQIKCLNFAVIDLALYLDTHPDDQKALCLHRKYTNELKELKDKYQKVFGPLDFYFPCNKWRWIEEPWPWERGNY